MAKIDIMLDQKSASMLCGGGGEIFFAYKNTVFPLYKKSQCQPMPGNAKQQAIKPTSQNTWIAMPCLPSLHPILCAYQISLSRCSSEYVASPKSIRKPPLLPP